MGLHPRFIGYYVLSVTVQVLEAWHVSINLYEFLMFFEIGRLTFAFLYLWMPRYSRVCIPGLWSRMY